METSLHTARYWFLIPLAIWVVWLIIIVWHDGLGLAPSPPNDAE